MTSRLAILCPGQGGQHAAMFELARSARHARTLPQQWQLDEKFGLPLECVLADDKLLFSNRCAQPLIVAATLATWEAIRQIMPRPSLVVGYSIGELAAYGVADALTPVDAINLAATRARLMDACVQPSAQQTLVAVSNLTAAIVGNLVRQHGFFIAIETAEDGCIAGGLAATAADFERAVVQAGGRVKPLAVGIASHTPLMRAAVQPFAEALARSRFTDPALPVLAGISAQAVWKKEPATAALAQQLAQKIRWMDCMDACAEAGITIALELGPGSALSRMLQARHPAIECRSVADFRTIEGIAAWFKRRFD